VVTDSRYTLQVEKQVDQAEFECRSDATPMSKAVGADEKVLVDSKLFSHAQVSAMKQKIPGLVLNSDEILVDTYPSGVEETPKKYKFFEHGISCSGRSLDEKLSLVR
jgi:hypothetical protein